MEAIARMPEPINLNASNLNDEWERFQQQFEIYLLACDLNDEADTRKIALLLNLIGPKCYRIYKSFDKETQSGSLTDVIKSFENYFSPKKNVIFERFKFNRITQKSSQSFDEFLTNLKTACSSCEYAQSDEMVRDRIVCGIACKNTQERLLRKHDLTLETCTEICKTAEATAAQLKEMHDEEKTLPEIIVDAVKTIKNCSRCGTTHNVNACPAYNKECEKCGLRNHFKNKCRTRNRIQRKTRKCDVLEQEEPTQEDGDGDMFHIYSIDNNSETHKQQNSLHKILKVGDHQHVNFKIDTGAESNILPANIYQNIKNAQLENTDITLVAYGGAKIEPLGTTTLKCQYKGDNYDVTFFVVDCNSSPILGFNSSIRLGIIQCVDNISCKEDLLEKYASTFEGLGEYPKKYKIKLRDDAIPCIQRARSVPLAIQEELKKKLDQMEEQQIIKKVNEPTDWVNSLVIAKKKNGDLRLCVDPTELNKAIRREHFPIPTAETIAAKLTGMKLFTVLDMKDGYLQVILDEESSDLTTFNTPFGRYKFLRLAFGLSSAPEVYQRMNYELFGDLPGVGIYCDDLIIAGQSKEEHDKNLLNVLNIANKFNIKFNKKKIQFRQPSVKYMGQTFSEKGISPDQSYVESINEFKAPENKTELLRVLGMAKFLSKFVPNMSKVTCPLRDLTRKEVPWSWMPEHDEALNNLKVLITKAPVLQYFDPKKETVLQCDASKDGLGACLLQDNHPIGFVSRSLTKCEQMYSQIEKELLAIAFGVTKFHYYIYGRPVTVQSDHRPLETIAKKSLCSVPPRLQRLLLKLSGYDLDIHYTPGSQLYIADFLSRAFLTIDKSVSGNTSVKVIHSLAEKAPISEAKKEEFRRAIQKDNILNEVKNYVINGWPANYNQLEPELKHFYKLKEQIKCDSGLLFINNKLIVPTAFQQSMLHLIHEGHLGINKCKRRARECLYWKGIASDIEKYIQQCSVCAKFSNTNVKEPLLQHNLPRRAWQRLACDIFSLNNKDYLALIDSYSNWIEMASLPTKTATTVIMALKSMFSRFGIPEKLQADNMPFNSQEFLEFAKEWDFECIFSSPRYARSNGLAEKGVAICKSLLKKCFESKTDISLALMNYRNTILKDVGLSPAQLILNKSIKTKLPCTAKQLKPKLNHNVTQSLVNRRSIQKQYYDRNSKLLKPLSVKDNVMLYDPELKSWKPAQVVALCKEPRSYMVKSENGHIVRRNRIFLRAFRGESSVRNEPISRSTGSSHCGCALDCRFVRDDFDDDYETEAVPQTPGHPEQAPPVAVRNPGMSLRNRTLLKRPARYCDD